MNQDVTIALDVMGGDFGAPVIVSAALMALSEMDEIRLILVGDEPVIREQLAKHKSEVNPRLSIVHASQVVKMDEPPSQALRGKKDSSMRVAINQVKLGEAGACVSAGNTGALMATARFVLKMLPGIDRPAICTSLPSIDGHTHMLDLGANAECSSEHLFQFAVMGSVLASAIENIQQPRVGLLNIGEEEIKGNETVKEAAALMNNTGLNYIGFVEGDDIYQGGVDVVVCDGFTGNVSLKTSEGLAKMIGQIIKEEFQRNWLTKLAGLAALAILRSVRRQIDPRNYNGASLLGLRGIVIKSHGSADAFAFANAIKIAALEVEKNVPQHIAEELEAMLTEKCA